MFYFADPWKYLVADKEAEKKWGFSLGTSLVTASKSKLLDGYKVFATSSVLPCPKELKGIYFLFLISHCLDLDLNGLLTRRNF